MKKQDSEKNQEVFSGKDINLRTELLGKIMYHSYKNPEEGLSELKSHIFPVDFDPDSIKPEYADLNSSPSQILECWHRYYTYAGIQGMPKNKKGAVHDTSFERRNYLEILESHLGHKPSGEDLKKLLDLPPAYNGICEAIDRDIESLF